MSSASPSPSFEKLPFLSSDDEATVIYGGSSKSYSFSLEPRRLRQSIPWHCAFHIFLLLTYTIVFAILYVSTAKSAWPNAALIPLSARSALHQEIRTFPTALRNNVFTGEPRPELDRAWHDLLSNNNIHVPSDEVKSLNVTSIELADGSGMVVQLGVFHALHCLKTIRRWVHKDYYFADATDHALWKMGIHVDHCIEYIRENLMCHPDVSLVTLHWITTDEGWKPTNKDSTPHECVNWHALNEWARKRVFDLYQLDRLKRPLPRFTQKG